MGDHHLHVVRLRANRHLPAKRPSACLHANKPLLRNLIGGFPAHVLIGSHWNLSNFFNNGAMGGVVDGTDVPGCFVASVGEHVDAPVDEIISTCRSSLVEGLTVSRQG